MFWLAPPNRTAPTLDAVYAGFARPAAEAIVRHGVERVVDVSALGRGVTDHAGLVSASLAMDDLFASTGAGFRALLMPSFMDNVLRQADAIKRQGMFFSTVSPDRKLPTCATRDIAAVAAGLLLDHSWSGQDTVAVLGPEDLSHNEMAEIIVRRARHAGQLPAGPDRRLQATARRVSACRTRWPTGWSR